MRFTVVCYRPDGSDYCRGCLMSTSSSRFELFEAETVDAAGADIAKKRFADLDPERGLAVCDWELTLLIDGAEYSGDDDAAEEARSCVEVAAKVHLQRMIDERNEINHHERQTQTIQP